MLDGMTINAADDGDNGKVLPADGELPNDKRQG